MPFEAVAISSNGAGYAETNKNITNAVIASINELPSKITLDSMNILASMHVTNSTPSKIDQKSSKPQAHMHNIISKVASTSAYGSAILNFIALRDVSQKVIGFIAKTTTGKTIDRSIGTGVPWHPVAEALYTREYTPLDRLKGPG